MCTQVFKSYPDLSSDRELINAVTDHYNPCWGLIFASVELCDDRDIVLRAVLKGNACCQLANTLDCASARLQADPNMRAAAKAAETGNKKKLAEFHAELADSTGKGK